MRHWCRVCGPPSRANEYFPCRPKKVKRRICKDCLAQVRALKRAAREARGHTGAEREIAGFLEQNRISKENIARLEELSASAPGRAREMAGLTLEAARIEPERKRRSGRLGEVAPDLLKRLRKYRLNTWEDKVKRPERQIRERIKAKRAAEAGPVPPADVMDWLERAEFPEEPTFSDPFGYYEPDSTDAFYWAFIRDDEDQRASSSRAKVDHLPF